MATIISGDQDTFRAMSYARPATTVSHRIEHDYQRALSTGIMHTGLQMLERARQEYERVLDSDPWRLARAAMNRIGSMWGSDVIQVAIEYTQLQNAKPIMQRWIMANPTVRKLYHEQRCDGYQGSYKDYQPGLVGKYHDDWCIVNEGVIHIDPETQDWTASTVSWTDMDGTELTLTEKMMILETHEHAEAGIREGRDVTSVWDDDL